MLVDPVAYVLVLRTFCLFVLYMIVVFTYILHFGYYIGYIVGKTLHFVLFL